MGLDDNELMVVEETKPQYVEADILNVKVSMDDKIQLAEHVATKLKDIIEKQDLAVKIGKNEEPYVTAEGWNALGTLLGTFARTDEVVPVDFTKSKYAYRARVSIIQGDHILATAEAIATSGGFQKEEHQVYSMAQTRAMGKAYRMAFSWIVKFAGYSATPAEEMEYPKPEKTVKKPRKAAAKKTEEKEIIETTLIEKEDK